MLAGGGASLCIAASSAQNTTIGPAAAVKAPAGRLVALASLGAGACAALIDPADARQAIVVQSARNSNRTTTVLPAGIQPLAMSRCNQHLLVIGARRSTNGRTAVVAATPVREGPHAAAAGAAGAASTKPSAATCHSA
jgi:hypothetical protein